MDAGTLGQYSGYIALVISMGTMVIGVFNHKKIVSKCCGRTASASLDISATTPPTPEPRPAVSV